jgi:hypothetical protein
MAGSNGLYNTMSDFYDFAVNRYHEEKKLEAAFEMFQADKMNISVVEGERRRGIEMHDQILVRLSWSCKM